MGISMYQGRYLDTVLQNQARRRQERGPGRQFQAIEDAAEKEAAEEEELNKALAARGVLIENTLQSSAVHF